VFALGGAALVFDVLLAMTSGFEFFADEWNVILRPDLSPESLLQPLNEHIVAGQVLVVKALLAIFGMGSTLPFRVANITCLLIVAGLTYSLVARRLGALVAALVAVVLVMLGPAWEDLLWPAGISFMGAMAGGLGAFVAIERQGRRADAVACLLLIVSISFSTLGLAFAVGVLVDGLLRPASRLARLWVAAVPFAAYGLWYLAYGSDASSPASLDNLVGVPLYVWRAAGSALASLTGLSGVGQRSLGSSSELGQPLLAVGMAAAGWAAAHNRALLSRRLGSLLAAALFFWIAAAINEVPGREPGASRYQLIGSVFVVLIAAELLRGRRLSRAGAGALAVVVAAVIASNVGALRDGQEFLRGQSENNAAVLAALDGARDQVPGDYRLDSAPASPFTSPATADEYFAAVDRWGAPVANPSDALNGTTAARAAADRFSVAALGAGVLPVPDTTTLAREGCMDLTSGGMITFEVPAGGTILRSEASLRSVRIGRWSDHDAPGVELGGAPAGDTALGIAKDSYERPWWVRVESPSLVESCPIDG
jgi:hypothetical protein